MGAKASTANGGEASGQSTVVANALATNGHPTGSTSFGLLRQATTNSSTPGERHRARSLSSVPDSRAGHHHHHHHDAVPVPMPLRLTPLQMAESPETDTSSPEDHLLDSPLAAHLGIGRFYAAQSLPAHIWSLNGIKCPVCSKFVLPDDIECHLVMCLTKPRLVYNEDVLTEDKGECVICLEELLQGDTIARLPCLCIYHKTCIDQWFEVNRSCPEHPSD